MKEEEEEELKIEIIGISDVDQTHRIRDKELFPLLIVKILGTVVSAWSKSDKPKYVRGLS